MTHETGTWYATATGVTFQSGTTLTINSGATLSLTGYSVDGGTPSSMAVTGAVTVGTTCNVVGNFSVATNKFNVTAASGNTAIAGTLGVTGNLTVATNKLVVTAASGNVVAAGTVTAGTATNPIILSNAGTRVAPASGAMQIYTDGSDLFAARNADTKTSKLSASWA
jgi:hypothetical protein